MVAEQIDAPDPETLVSEAKAAFRDGAVLSVQARCEVEYDGRTSGHLGPGDRLLVAKPDGTFLVHQPTGHKPVNWMPGGGTVSARESDGEAVLLARRTNPTERVEARIFDAHGLTRFDATDGATYEESGTEAEMHEYIERNPEVLEEGLRIVEHERESKYGFIDFFARDESGTPVVVEVKRIQATLNHFDQLQRYVSLYEDGEESPEDGVTADDGTVRGMLVAPDASERVRRALRDNGLEFAELAEFDTDAKGATEAKLTDF
ncbi:endonuclease NucS [Halorussus gelatinilyticus]|uniref:Endonuclease NucS n=1 Tax=Halorussus gelatinilyticus TaxID=2937524 RepID=A0A8U0IKR2_9EURY|nr:endonuclease NucS [Halorussus gelatinilyticus]UPW01266.1 endonuclease NucS [Halorussus gelatinilyticus]